MKDVRITFRAEDFAAVSKSMIELGVRFQVEPMEPRDDEAVASGGRGAASSGAPRRSQGKQKSAKAGRQSRGAEGAGSGQASESSAAARLRAMAERNRAAAGRAAGEGTLEGYAPPADAEPT